jgi:Alr-MurF fusion protein
VHLNIDFPQFCFAVQSKVVQGDSDSLVQRILFDTRKIHQPQETAFFALRGDFRDGHDFVAIAFEKGVRIFVVERLEPSFPVGATYVVVHDTLMALQALATYHRQQFNFPILAITGTVGKTSVKEWLSWLLKPSVKLMRSPKSYNSQLGVALSLLQLHEHCDLAIIEAAATKPGEMERLYQMIQPNYGVLTNILPSLNGEFPDLNAKKLAYCTLFSSCQWVVCGASSEKLFDHQNFPNFHFAKEMFFKEWAKQIPFLDEVSRENALTAVLAAHHLGLLHEEKISSLPRLALRLETFEGLQGSTIINDAYHLDLDALRSSLEYQWMLAGTQRRKVIIGLTQDSLHLEPEILKVINDFQPIECAIGLNPHWQQLDLTDAVVLVKGTRHSNMEKVARQLRLKQHTTQLIFDWSALRNNVSFYKNNLSPDTKILAMVKAQAYGTGLEKMGLQLERFGVDYLGVAYPDEGAELRLAGVRLPILVMNTEPFGFETCLTHQLIPAVYSFTQLDELLKFLIVEQVERFPIHLKVDTGMKRLGFEQDEIPALLALIQAQPEIEVVGVYSHLASADQADNDFVKHQMACFEEVVKQLKQAFHHPLIAHLANSDGALNYPEAHFDMVRLGIGMYGISNHLTLAPYLHPVLQWKSRVSQVKMVKKGESVGYGQTFRAPENVNIATIPVGYADGFRRSLSNGQGGVFIKGIYCPTVGRVCMDMTMVLLPDVSVFEGDEVEIIGEHQTLNDLAKAMNTIPYEVLTSISKRVHRSYSEEA